MPKRTIKGSQPVSASHSSQAGLKRAASSGPTTTPQVSTSMPIALTITNTVLCSRHTA